MRDDGGLRYASLRWFLVVLFGALPSRRMAGTEPADRHPQRCPPQAIVSCALGHKLDMTPDAPYIVVPCAPSELLPLLPRRCAISPARKRIYARDVHEMCRRHQCGPSRHQSRRSRYALRQHPNMRHHAGVFVLQNVAVIDKIAYLRAAEVQFDPYPSVDWHGKSIV
jgi:hypothetical protein